MITLLILIAIAALIIFALLCVCGVIASALSGVIFVAVDIAIAILILRLAFGGHKKKKDE